MIDQVKPRIRNEYLQKCFNKKTLITKAIVFAIALVVVLIPSLTMYYWCLKQTSAMPWGEKPFIYIQIVHNDGIGFSALKGNVGAIYTIQTLILLVLIAVYLFVCNDKITMSFVALAICGGAFNLFQRMVPYTFMGVTYHNCVLDYIQFGFWKSFATFNFPDSFVVVGSIGFAISYITLSIIKAVKEDKKEKEIVSTKPQDKPEETTLSNEWGVSNEQ